jgi:hypothetical protein
MPWYCSIESILTHSSTYSECSTTTVREAGRSPLSGPVHSTPSDPPADSTVNIKIIVDVKNISMVCI